MSVDTFLVISSTLLNRFVIGQRCDLLSWSARDSRCAGARIRSGSVALSYPIDYLQIIDRSGTRTLLAGHVYYQKIDLISRAEGYKR